MPKLIKKIIKGRPKFNYESYDKAKTIMWDQIAARPNKVPGDTDTEEFTRKIEALAMHIGGMPLPEAARISCMTPAKLTSFKNRWLSRDSSLAPLLANLLEASAVKGLMVYNAKADDMDATEAASAAATLTKAAVTLRTGANTNYIPPENVALETLDRIAKVLTAADNHKQLKGKIIDV